MYCVTVEELGTNWANCGSLGDSIIDSCYLLCVYMEIGNEIGPVVDPWGSPFVDICFCCRVMMTESYSETEKLFPFYGNATHDGAHFTFNFWFITKLGSSSNARDMKYYIDKWFTYMPLRYTANWVVSKNCQF